MFLAYAAYQGFKVYQMDAKRAFLNGKLQEEVYVEQPPGFEDSKYPRYVYRLDKTLYGLKQAPKAWYETHSTFLRRKSTKQAPKAVVQTRRKAIDLSLKETVQTITVVPWTRKQQASKAQPIKLKKLMETKRKLIMQTSDEEIISYLPVTGPTNMEVDTQSALVQTRTTVEPSSSKTSPPMPIWHWNL
ncbi:Retrovirus-related Pol polyprotein from transposon RE2-like protein [Drosera capensis]